LHLPLETLIRIFAWHIVSLQPRERMVVVLAEKKATISPKTWLEHHAPAKAAKKMLSKFVISLALRNFSIMK